MSDNVSLIFATALLLIILFGIDILYKKKVDEKLEVLGRSQHIINRLFYLFNFLLGKILEYFTFFIPFNSLRCLIHRFRGVRIGKNVYIGEQVIFDRVYPSLISIGNNTSIGDRCIIAAHSNATLPSKRDKWAFLEKVEKINIGNNVWIMPNVTIGPGVNIGDNVVINTGSIVTKDVGSGSIVNHQSSTITSLPKKFSN